MLPPSPGWITRTELVRRLGRLGFRCTATQVEYWHKHGLVDRPRKTSKGRGRGTESHYPPIAIFQASGVCYLRGGGWRAVPELGWGLWCLGFPPTDRARSYLARFVATELDRQRRTIQAFEEGQSGNPIERAEMKRLPSPLGTVRRVVGRGFMPTLARLQVEMDLGRVDLIHNLEVDDLERMSRIPAALGWMSKLERRPSTEEFQEVRPAVIQWLEELVAGMGLDRVLRALPKLPERTLDQCRDELLVLIRDAVIRAGLREPFEVVIPPRWLVTYLQARVLHPKLNGPVYTMLTEAAKAGAIPLPRPAPAVPLLNALAQLEATDGRPRPS